jgi:hypothetical protein
MLQHAAASARRTVVREGLFPGSTFAELHSVHGGSWAPDLQRLGMKSVGDHMPADLVADVHFLMHEENLDSVLTDHAARLKPQGVLVCEFFHALPMVSGNLIDTVRHGHYSYLSLISAAENLARHDLAVTWVAQVQSYGGSLQLVARPTSQEPTIDDSVNQLRRGRGGPRRLKSELETLKRRGHRVAAYGAPSKATVLLTLAEVDRDLLPYTVDLSAAKHGRRIPGTSIPIRSVEDLLHDRPDDIVLLTWDIANEVADQLARQARGMVWDPVLYVPLPEFRRRSLNDTNWIAVS